MQMRNRLKGRKEVGEKRSSDEEEEEEVEERDSKRHL